MAWRQYHENSLIDNSEIAAVTSGSNKQQHTIGIILITPEKMKM